MGKTSKFPDELTATTRAGGTMELEKLLTQVLEVLREHVLLADEFGGHYYSQYFSILYIVFVIHITYYMYYDVICILYWGVSLIHLLFWYLTMTYHCIPCNDDHLIH